MSTATQPLACTPKPSKSKNQTTVERPGDAEIVMKRTFNAAPSLVFTAWTRADLVKQWWGPASHGVTISESRADVRVGGAYRYVMRQADGTEQGFSGTYSEVTPHSRLVYTQVFEPMADAGAVVVTVTFEAQPDGKTHLVSHEVYPSKEALDTALECGMEHGALEIMDQLDELLPTLELT
jgi:uncharacterized protein YndB with AHSA1/START domain